MKINLSLLSLLLCVGLANAQSAKYSGFSAAKFKGIQTEDGNLFYTTNRGEALPDTPYSYVIQIYNAELQRVSNERVVTAWNSEVVDVESHNDGLLFYLQSQSDAKILYFDSQGKKEWLKTIELDKNKYTNAQMRSLGAEGFAIIRPDKADKNGFKLSLFDNQLNEKWSLGEYPEKGNIQYDQIAVSGGKIGVLAEYQKGIFSSVVERRLYVYSGTDGSLQYQHLLGDGDNRQHPARFSLNPDGSAFVIGYTYDSDLVPDELFYTEVDQQGKSKYLQKLDFPAELAPQMSSQRAKDNFNLPEDRQPFINIHSILPTEDGYQIIGEKYNYTAIPIPKPENGVTIGTSGKGKLMVMDYVVLEITASGKLKDVRNIAKPHKLINTEGPNFDKELYAESYLGEYKLFSFSHLNEKNGTPMLVSMNWHRSMPYIGFTSLEASHENVLNRIYLDKSIPEATSRGEYTESTLSVENSQSEVWTLHYGVLPYKEPGKMLYYHYEGGEVAMEVIDMEVDMPKPANGELKLGGIPAEQFQGVSPVAGSGYSAFYLSEKAEEDQLLYIYHRFDQDLNTTGRSVLSVPGRAAFAGEVSDGNGEVLIFQNTSDRSWYFYDLDSNGVLQSQKRLALSESAKQVPTGNLLLESADDGFTMIQPYIDTARQIRGYQVIRVDGNHNVRWNHSHEAPKDEVIQLSSTASENGVVTVVHNQRPYRAYDQVSNKLIALNDETGELMFEWDLSSGANAGFPQSVRVTPSRQVVTTGMYFEGQDFKKANSNGLFLLQLSASGEKLSYTETPWEKVEEAINTGNEGDFLMSGKTKILIQDMILSDEGNFKVVGELYRKSLGVTGAGLLLGDDLDDRAFSIFDFVVFDFDAKGQLKKMYRVPKEEQNINISGSVGRQRGLALSLLMKKYNMFSYLKTMEMENQPQVLFTSSADRKKRVYRSDLTSGNSNYPSASAQYTLEEKAPDEMNKLEQLNSKLETMGQKLEDGLSGTDQTFTTFRDPHNGFAVSVPTEVLNYYYDKEAHTLMLQLEAIQ